MEHKPTIPNYNKTLEDLAFDLADLRYDALSYFIEKLAYKIRFDADNDLHSGRFKLSNELKSASITLNKTKEYIDNAWEISKPFMGKITDFEK
jgi:hypothetical protein